MPSFFDLMKYAKTGIASPDMTGFDKLRSLAAFGGYPVSTITGVPPISFKADGKPLISWSMLGNGQQSGTPTPDAPIMPEFCGERTAQLFDVTTLESGIYLASNSNKYGNITNGVRAGTKIKALPNADYTLSAQSSGNVSLRIFEWSNGTFTNQTPKYNISGNVSITVTTGADTTEIAFNIEGENGQYATNIMLNTGSTALPYEPFGYKIPLTCGGQTVPVYLGQTQTVRKIKKLVLTGEETIGYSGNNNAPYKITVSDIIQVSDQYAILFVCSHYRAVSNAASWASYPSCVTWSFSDGKNLQALNFRDQACADAYAFKTYLAQQYAAGTPVTVWYVLATPETGIVNEPLCKIGDYADELHSTDAAVTIPTIKGQNTLTVDTDLQPSAVSVTGNIKAI